MAALYVIWQCTWGVLQTLVGACVFLLYRTGEHSVFHGAVVTKWKRRSSVSLGMFLFLTEGPVSPAQGKDGLAAEDLRRRLLVHEYGHTVQSLILGPLYLLVIGLPSALWAASPGLARRRRRDRRSYFSFYTERWANKLGEMATGEPAAGLW